MSDNGPAGCHRTSLHIHSVDENQLRVCREEGGVGKKL